MEELEQVLGIMLGNEREIYVNEFPSAYKQGTRVVAESFLNIAMECGKKEYKIFMIHIEKDKPTEKKIIKELKDNIKDNERIIEKLDKNSILTMWIAKANITAYNYILKDYIKE